MITEQEYINILRCDQAAFTEECFRTLKPRAKFEDNWHIHCMIEHLQAVENNEIESLIINMPPRSLKSVVTSIAWTAWLLGQNPSMQLICATYGARLSLRQSVDVRRIMQTAWYRKVFPETIIAADQGAKEKFDTTQGGYRMATSVGGSVTGDGGDILMLDDPMDPEGANSDAERENANEWVSGTFMSRANDQRNPRMVVVMQRLHEGDVTGVLLEQGGWTHLVLPAQFVKKTVIEINGKRWEKDKGEYLHEGRLGNEELKRLERRMGAQAFAGQYMQNPTPLGGGEFKDKYIQYYDNYHKDFTAEGMNVYILYDAANTKKEKATKKNSEPCFTAAVVVGLARDGNYYILDMVRDLLGITDRIEMVFELHKKWYSLSGNKPKVVSEQYGLMVENELMQEKMRRDNYRFGLIEVKTTMAKDDRIRGLIPAWENYQIFLPKSLLYKTAAGEVVDIIDQFIKHELRVFPVGRIKDALDALSWIVHKDVGARFPMMEHKNRKRRDGYESYRDEVRNADSGTIDYMSW